MNISFIPDSNQLTIPQFIHLFNHTHLIFKLRKMDIYNKIYEYSFFVRSVILEVDLL